MNFRAVTPVLALLLVGSNAYGRFCGQDGTAAGSVAVADSDVQPVAAPGRENYRIGAGDVLEIRVLGEDQMSSPSVRVAQDGFVMVPFVNEPVMAMCRTERELGEEIATRLKKFLKYPEVYVAVKEFNSISVAIIGAVNQPGRFQMQRRVSVLELLTYAGGVKTQAGKVIQLIHLSPEVVCDASSATSDAQSVEGAETLNLKKLLEGDAETNRAVRPGDVLFVPDSDMVFVAGEVLKPNAYPLREGLTFTQALALAGGPTRLAKNGDIRIVRTEPGKPRVIIPVDIKAIQANRAEDPLMFANDVIEVPNSAGKTFLNGFLGAVGGSLGNLPVTAIP